MYLLRVKDAKEGDKTGVIYTSKFERGESKILMDNIPIPYTVNEIPENVLLRHIMISHEGTLIRVFFNNGEWNISTKNNLDARNALWGDVNLGDLFIERVGGLENLTSRLNQMHQYLFLMSYPEQHKYVCKVTKKIWHYGTFVSGNLVFTENVQGYEKPRRPFYKRRS